MHTVVDPDLQIRGVPGHPDPDIRGGGGWSPKKHFWPFGPQSGLKIWGGGQVPQAPPLDPSLAHFVQ